MRKIFLLLLTGFVLSAGIVFSQTLSEVIMPQYIQGMNGTNITRMPFAFRVTFDGLKANSTYMYKNQLVISSDVATANGAGNCIFVNTTGDFVRSTGPDYTKAGAYGTFVTDAAGSFTGWFVSEPTSNKRFVPGAQIYARIAINNGNGGTTDSLRFTTSSYATVINFGTTSPAAANEGTGVYGLSAAADKDFVFLYDNEAGTGRPLAGTFIENDGTDNSVANSYAEFYSINVNAVSGAWGVIVPNILPDGIKRIERRALSTGEIVNAATSTNGVWEGVSTVNPVSGLAAVKINNAALPVELVSFTASSEKNNVVLSWTTASETNNYGFEIQRSLKGGSWEKAGFVKGSLNSTVVHNYSYSDKNLKNGKYLYRLRQVDMSGEYDYSSSVEVTVKLPAEFALSQNYPNPFNPSTSISYQVPSAGHVTLKVYNAIGSEVAVIVNDYKEAGSHSVSFNASDLSSGIYFYKLTAGKSSLTKKMIVLK